jgi:hypothetical protein
MAIFVVSLSLNSLNRAQTAESRHAHPASPSFAFLKGFSGEVNKLVDK